MISYVSAGDSISMPLLLRFGEVLPTLDWYAGFRFLLSELLPNFVMQSIHFHFMNWLPLISD